MLGHVGRQNLEATRIKEFAQGVFMSNRGLLCYLNHSVVNDVSSDPKR